jgi:NADPH:quinone reductase-like Zn-dependent oxidoreductase
MFGARIYSTTGSDEKIARLKELGVSEVINYRSREDWDVAIMELTAKRGVDHVVEVGGSGTLAKSLNAVRFGGHVAMIGALTGPAGFNPTTVFMKSVRLQGIFTGPRTMFEDLVSAITVSEMHPVIDRVFEFTEAREAMHYMQSGAHFGKVVIKI